MLHSFYCWGAVGVILGSTLFFTVFGVEHWKILTLIWAVIPLYNAFNFITCPIEWLDEDGKAMRPGQLLRLPLFWLLILLMVCSGASEASMAQWASDSQSQQWVFPRPLAIWQDHVCLQCLWEYPGFCAVILK